MNSFASIKNLLRYWPNDPLPVEPYPEHPHERLRLALLKFDNVGTGDLIVLVRHVLRFEHAHHGGTQRLELPLGGPWPTVKQWKEGGCRVRNVGTNVDVEAEPWSPNWLTTLHFGGASPEETNTTAFWDDEQAGSNTPLNTVPMEPFAAVEAEEIRHPRVSDQEKWKVRADPALTESFNGFTHYLSAAQAETVRCVMFSPPGSTRLIVLPTGSGKSLVGLANAFIGKWQTGVALVIVPTIALAFDQVEQARVARPKDSVDAWHSGLNKAQRAAIRQRLRAGNQRLLFLAPESLRVLKDELLTVAADGWLRSLVVDEAHLISQWGGSFRPEMQLMSVTLKQIRENCPVGAEFRTLLMTATLTAETYADLTRLFGDMETVAAVHLRPEPDYFMARCQTEDEKDTRILEALRHAPRPAILYLTKVDDAKKWHQRCVSEGWLRTGLVHGESTSAEREQAISRWRENQLDLMVATSAFGLGMDKGDVRLVLHACVPETLDRFYQEVGRGGRDGRASVSLMIWTTEDLVLANRMSSANLISDELGLDRWRSMWGGRKDRDDIADLNLRTTRPGLHWDSDRNIEWNLRTVLLLVRAGVLELQEVPSPDLARSPNEDDEDYQFRRESAWAKADATCAVRLIRANPLDESNWNDSVGNYRQQSLQTGATNWQRMKDMLELKRSVPDVLREVYQVPQAGIDNVDLHPSEVVVPTPPKQLCLEVSETLTNAMATATNGLLILTYEANQFASYELLRNQIALLKTLVRLGVREVAVPAEWLERSHWDEHRNPLQDLARSSVEGFIVVRDIAESDPWDRRLSLPRLSLIMPDTRLVPTSLYSLNCPVHLLVMPEGSPDPANPSRLIGDVRPNVMPLKDFAHLLKL